MIYFLAILSFAVALLYNFIPGLFIFLFINRKNKINIIECILLSFLLSLSVNVIFMQFASLFSIEINQTITFLYIFLFLILSFKYLIKSIAKPLNKYEKYLIYASIFWFIILFLTMSFGYFGLQYDDMPRHTGIIKASVENKGFIENQPYFFVEAKNNYPKSVYSLLINPLILLNITNPLIILQTTNLFFRFMALLSGFMVFIAARLFTKSNKIAFYSGISILFLGLANSSLLYWGGYPIIVARVLYFTSFVLLWKAFMEKKEKNKNLLISSLLIVTGMAIRPSIVFHLPIFLIILVLFFRNKREELIKNILFFGIFAGIFSIIFYDIILTYINTFLSGTIPYFDYNIITKISYLGAFILPLILFSIPSFRENKTYPLAVLGSLYIAIALWFKAPQNIMFNFIYPFSIIAGITWKKYIEKNKKILYIGLISSILFLSAYSVILTSNDRPINLDQEEINFILWIKYNLDKNARIFYVSEHFFDWIGPISGRTATWGQAPFSPEVDKINKEFEEIGKQAYNNEIDKIELYDFFNKYKITHLILSDEEFNRTRNYFDKNKILYKEKGFYILEISDFK